MPKTKKINVFLIDDSEVDSFLTKKILEDSPNIAKITEFISSKKALDFIIDKNNASALPDLILLDISMPVLDGFEFLDEIEESEVFGNKFPFKIFIITNSRQIRDTEKYERESALTDYILKPIAQEQLEEKISQHFK